MFTSVKIAVPLDGLYKLVDRLCPTIGVEELAGAAVRFVLAERKAETVLVLNDESALLGQVIAAGVSERSGAPGSRVMFNRWLTTFTSTPGTRSSYALLCEAVAARGFIVLAPEHRVMHAVHVRRHHQQAQNAVDTANVQCHIQLLGQDRKSTRLNSSHT